MEIRWTQASRKHRVGRHHARYLMATVRPEVSTRPSGETELTFEGLTQDGWGLTVVAVVLGSGTVLVVHVQPIYRGRA